jgi:hypothetical protein
METLNIFDWRVGVLIIIILIAVIGYMAMSIVAELNYKDDRISYKKNLPILELKGCLDEGMNMSKECRILISQRDSERNCEKIIGDINECYSLLAFYKHDGSLCYNINDEMLKRECTLRSEPYQGA